MMGYPKASEVPILLIFGWIEEFSRIEPGRGMTATGEPPRMAAPTSGTDTPNRLEVN